MNILLHDYTIFNISRIILLALGGLIIKKYIKSFPDQLIPITIILLSTVITFIFFPYFQELTPWDMRLVNGPICGLAAIGLHQTIKQLIEYMNIRKLKKQIRKSKEIKTKKVS